MPLEVLNLSLRFTTDSTRFTGCHLVAFWFLRRDGTVWTPEVNQQPYVWVVASGETKLQQRKTFDLVLNDLVVDCDYLCDLLSDCNVKRGRVMVIPCCRVNLPQSTLLNNFINSVQTSNNEGKQYLTVGSAEWNFIAPQLHSIMTNLVVSPGIGEAYIDVDIVNSRFYTCSRVQYVLYYLPGGSTIHQGNTGSLTYKSCRNMCDDGTGNEFDDVIFPQPTDLGNNPVPFTLLGSGGSFTILNSCFNKKEPLVSTGGLIQSVFYDEMAFTCCDKIVTYNITAGANSFFLWYQDGDPASPTYGHRVGKKLTNGDSLNGLKVMFRSLTVFYDSDDDGTFAEFDVIYNNSYNSYSSPVITITATSVSEITC